MPAPEQLSKSEASQSVALQDVGQYYDRERQGSYGRDTHDMARVQKKQIITRKFGFLSMLGFSCTVLITWEGATVLFIQSFSNGGPSGVIYGYILVWLGTLSTSIVLSELASMIPSAAGQYLWCYALAPKSCRKFLSYLTGWLIVCGWQAFVASGGFLSGTMLTGLISLVNDSYMAQPWHTLLFYWAVVLICVLANSVLARWLAKLEGFILVLHLAGFFAIMIPLVTLSDHKSPQEVFNNFLNEGAWPTQGLSFMIGLIGNVYAFFGVDSAIHMSEEVKHASVAVPWSIMTSLGINGCLGFVMLLVLLFCLGDVDQALNSRTGFPFMEIFVSGTGSVWGSAIMVAIIVLMSFCALVGILASASRVLWAFARDRAMPGWNAVRKVHLNGSVPMVAVAITMTTSMLLALILLGSVPAFNALISLTVASLFCSYLISGTLLLWRRMRGEIKEEAEPAEDTPSEDGVARIALVWGPWRLKGWVGIANNALAVAYLTVILFFSFWPPMNPPNAGNMNYSVLMFGAVIMFSLLYYVIWARHEFRGPRAEV